jgi:N-sulfoglucosamine sulfohydrolase
MKPILILISLCTLAAAETKAPLPDIVVFISDDHSILDSEPYGATTIRTPNMQKLADEGMKFTHAFAASPSCGPSRTALLTGLWPARNGAEPNHNPRRPDIPGLPTNLQALGYEVVAIGKVAHNSMVASYHFDFTAGSPSGCVDSTELEKFLKTRASNKPLCLFFGTHFPHTDWLANDGYDPATLHLPATFIDTAATRSQRAEYLSSVTAADTLLGEVRALAQKFLTPAPLFIYTADHGAAWPFAKWDLYDAGIRVPFIISWPGHLKAATTSDAMLCLPDLLPTFIDLAGGTVPAGLDGKSFAAILRGSSTTHRDRVFATCSGDGDMNVYPSRSLRTRDFKYILNLHPEFQHHTHISLSPNPKHGRAYWDSWQTAARENPTAAAIVKRYIQRPAEELYDLSADPNELHNLAAEAAHSERLAAMRQELKAWMKQQGDSETVFGNPLLLTQPTPEVALKPRKKKSSK